MSKNALSQACFIELRGMAVFFVTLTGDVGNQNQTNCLQAYPQSI